MMNYILLLKRLLFLLVLVFSINAKAQFGPEMVVAPTFSGLSHQIPIDVDNDGDLDIIMASSLTGQIAWIQHLDGQGTFGAPQLISVFEKNVSALQAADLDGDNDPDIVVSNAAQNSISWFENLDGAGEFGPASIITNDASGVGQIALEDLDLDEDLDIIAAINGEGTIWTFENIDGAGLFGTPSTIAAGLLGTISFVPADLNSDTKVDIAFGAESVITLSWIENLGGAGNFSFPIVVDILDVGTIDVQAGNIDDDAGLDLVAIDKNGTTVLWYDNLDGDGTNWAEATVTNLPADREINEVLIYDMDEDSDMDLFYVGRHSLNVQFYFYWSEHIGVNEEDFIGIEQVFSSNDELFTPAFVDLDGDNLKDLIAAFSDNSINWYEQYEPNTVQFSSSDLIFRSESGRFPRLGDINSDGKPDLITGNTWIENTGNPPYYELTRVIHPSFDDFATDFEPFDIDQDGDVDIIVCVEDDDKISWFENIDGLGNFQEHLISNDHNDVGQLKIADFDGDGTFDILAVTSYPSSQNNDKIALYRNLDGNGTFDTGTNILPDAIVRGIEVADLDNDGDLDFAGEIGFPGQTTKTYWLENDGSGNFSSQSITTIYSSHHIQLLDMDGDFDNDLLFVGNGLGVLGWYENVDGTGSFTEWHNIDGDQPTITDMIAGDPDQDGDWDIFLAAYLENQIIFYEAIDNQGNYEEPVVFSDFERPFSLYFGNVDHNGGDDLFVGGDQEYRISMFENLFDKPKVDGFVFWDENENGSFDAVELPLFQQPLQMAPEALGTWSGQDGSYSFAVNLGEHELTIVPGFGWESTTDQTVDLTVTSPDIAYEAYFGLKANDPFHAANIEISSAPTRCFSEVPAWVTYTNGGNTYASGIITLELDPLTTFVSASPAPSTISGNTFTWNFEDLPPTQSSQIELLIEMPGPDFIGTPLLFFGNMQIENDNGEVLADATGNYQPVITCAYDPNDKLVDPSFVDYANYAVFGETLEYTVRFQNTGNDTAFQVEIFDNLDPQLDWSSFEVLAASHANQTTLDANGRVRFLFPNILLPDSTTNEPGSHGFIKFSIRPKPDLPENTEINNFAAIYFDLNPPIITNTVTTVLVSAFPLQMQIDHACNGEDNGSLQPITYDADWQFDWNNGETSPIIENLVPGDYELTITHPAGIIIADTSFTILAGNPMDLTITTVDPTGNNDDGMASVVVDGGIPPLQFIWSTDPPQTTDTAFMLNTGMYTLRVTDSIGCTILTEVSVGPVSAFQPSAKTPVFNIFPNPTQGSFQLEVELENQVWEMEISTLLGQSMRKRKGIGSRSWEETALPPGVYAIRLSVNGALSTTLLLVE